MDFKLGEIAKKASNGQKRENNSQLALKFSIVRKIRTIIILSMLVQLKTIAQVDY